MHTPAAPTLITLPTLAAGEIYAGLAFLDGRPAHHLILLPAEAEGVTWDQAREWAASIGGELPTRKEQALLFANLPNEFKPRWYWSGAQHESDPDYVWYQYFDRGYQDYSPHGSKLRARAVRRLPI